MNKKYAEILKNWPIIKEYYGAKHFFKFVKVCKNCSWPAYDVDFWIDITHKKSTFIRSIKKTLRLPEFNKKNYYNVNCTCCSNPRYIRKIYSGHIEVSLKSFGQMLLNKKTHH